MKVVLLSGYKPFELGVINQNHPGIQYIKKGIQKRLESLVEEGLEWVVISGQPGVELWGADVVFSLQEKYPDLKLAVFLPFLNQESNWNESRQEEYHLVLEQADHVDVISKRPYEGPWQLKAKNEFLVHHSDGLLLLYDEEKKGSPQYYLQAALKKQKQTDYSILFITPMDIEMIVEEERLSDPNFWT